MLSNYRPDFWRNQPKLVTKIVTAKDVEEADGVMEVMFKSTNEVYVITRCKPYNEACGAFEYDFKKKTFVKPDEK